MFMKAESFRIKTLINQNNAVAEAIEKASHSAASTIRFDFVFYYEIAKDLKTAGWEVYNIKKENEIVGQLVCPEGLFTIDDIPEDIEEIPEDV